MTNPKPKPNANSYPHKDINPNKVETPKRKKNGKEKCRERVIYLGIETHTESDRERDKRKIFIRS